MRLNFNKLFNTASNSLYIATNTITAVAPNYCTYGLAFGQGHKGANTGVPQDAINVTANTITNANTAAIYANNVNISSATSGFLQIYNNTELSIKYNPACTTLTTPRMAAVSISGSYYTRVTYNPNIKLTGFSTGNGIMELQEKSGQKIFSIMPHVLGYC